MVVEFFEVVVGGFRWLSVFLLLVTTLCISFLFFIDLKTFFIDNLGGSRSLRRLTFLAMVLQHLLLSNSVEHGKDPTTSERPGFERPLSLFLMSIAWVCLVKPMLT